MTPPTHAGEAWVCALSTALDRPIDWDGTGECTLEFENHIDVTFIALPQDGLMVARAEVTLEDQALTPGALRLALTLNHAQLPPGFTLALDDDTGQFVLLAVMHDGRVSPEFLFELLDGFNALLPQLRSQLATPAAMAQDGAMGNSI